MMTGEAMAEFEEHVMGPFRRRRTLFTPRHRQEAENNPAIRS
jgi:hypothetical protein